MVYRFIAAANDAPFIGNYLVLFLNDLMRDNQRVTRAYRREDLKVLKSQPGFIFAI